MESLLILASRITNYAHDFILLNLRQNGMFISDKELHFLVFGLIGMIIFFISNAAFKYLQQWGLGAVSFVFTVIVLTVLTVGIEIEQNITGGGRMEATDVFAGLAGFLVIFALYLMIAGLWRLLALLTRKISGHGQGKPRRWYK